MPRKRDYGGGVAHFYINKAVVPFVSASITAWYCASSSSRCRITAWCLYSARRAETSNRRGFADVFSASLLLSCCSGPGQWKRAMLRFVRCRPGAFQHSHGWCTHVKINNFMFSEKKFRLDAKIFEKVRELAYEQTCYDVWGEVHVSHSVLFLKFDDKFMC